MLGLSFPLVACLAADPGVEGLTRGEFSEGGAGFDSGPAGDGGGDSATDAPPGDTGTDGTTSTTAFTGAAAYDATKQPPTSAVTNHNNDNVGITPGKNQDCLSCHKMGGAGPVFLFAGTVFQDMNGATPAVAKQICVLGNDAKSHCAYSDTDGNFWYEPGTNETLVFPAQSGIRDGTNTELMTNSLSASSCNATGCHDGTTQAYLHLP